MSAADLRTETELTWYWLHSADEVTSSVRAINYEQIYLGQLSPPSVRIEGTDDVGLRCGHVYVSRPAASYREPSVEPDYRSLVAQRRRNGIRLALARLASLQRARLELAFGQRPEVLRIRGWPLPLIACLPLASALHRASGSARRLDSWLMRLADKTNCAGAIDLEFAADAQIARDSRAYVAARTGR